MVNIGLLPDNRVPPSARQMKWTILCQSNFPLGTSTEIETIHQIGSKAMGNRAVKPVLHVTLNYSVLTISRKQSCVQVIRTLSESTFEAPMICLIKNLQSSACTARLWQKEFYPRQRRVCLHCKRRRPYYASNKRDRSTGKCHCFGFLTDFTSCLWEHWNLGHRAKSDTWSTPACCSVHKGGGRMIVILVD